MKIQSIISIATSCLLLNACGGSEKYKSTNGSNDLDAQYIVKDKKSQTTTNDSIRKQNSAVKIAKDEISIVDDMIDFDVNKKINHELNGNDYKQDNKPVTLDNISAKSESFIEWDRNTISDKVGKIEFRSDIELLSPYGLKKIGNDLVTSERVTDIDGKNGFLVAASKYHNALNVIDYNTKTYKYNKFASFNVNYNKRKGGLAGGIMSNTNNDISMPNVEASAIVPPDISSGASSRSLKTSSFSRSLDESCNTYDVKNEQGLWEHTLNSANIDSSGSYVYALINPRVPEQFSSSASFGIFKTEIGYCGVNPYNAKSTLKVDSTNIGSIKLSNDDSKLLAYKKGGGVIVYNASDLSVKSSVSLRGVKSVDFAKNSSLVVALSCEDEFSGHVLSVYDTSSLIKLADKKIDFKADFVFGSNDKLVAVSKDSGIVKMYDFSLNELSHFKLGFKVLKAKISHNQKVLALGIAGVNEQTSVAFFSLTNSTLNNPSIKVTNGLDAMGFAGEDLFAYTPKSNPNSVQILKLSFDKNGGIDGGINEPNQNDQSSEENVVKFDEFKPLSLVASQKIYSKTSLIASFDDLLATYSYTSEDDKGLNILSLKSDTFDFKVGSSGDYDNLDQKHVYGLEFLSKTKMLVVDVNKHYPGMSIAYIQGLNNDGTLKKSDNSKLNPAYISHKRDLEAVKVSKNAQRFFTLGKHFTRHDYFVDVYKFVGQKYELDSSYKQKHMQSSKNTLAVDASGKNFYTLGSDKVYKNGDEVSVDVKGGVQIFYIKGLVIVARNDGKFYTFNDDLDENSKKVYEFKSKIVDVDYDGYRSAIFTNDGIYTFDTNGGILKQNKKYELNDIVNGYTKDGKIFAITNADYSVNSASSSTINYFKF